MCLFWCATTSVSDNRSVSVVLSRLSKEFYQTVGYCKERQNMSLLSQSMRWKVAVLSQWVLVALVTVFGSIWDKIVFANLHNGVWRVLTLLTLLLTPTMNKHCSGSNLAVLCFYSLAEQSHGASSTITDDRILFWGQFLCLSHLLPLNTLHDTRSYRPATTFI